MANRVHVEVTGDDARFRRTLSRSEKDAKGFKSVLHDAFGVAAGNLMSNFAMNAGRSLRSFISFSTEAATALGESQNAVQKVFGDSAASIDAYGNVAADVAGLSKREFNELSTVTGALLKNVGFSMDEAASKSITLTNRAADMASVFNTDVGTALEAINSALKGEANPIEQYGVKVNAATIEAKALAMGLADTKAELDDNAKATATLQLIMEQTAGTAGDFAQTTDDLANAQRRAAARAENAAAKFGRAWTPIFAEITNFAADALLSIQALGGDEVAKMELRVSEAMNAIRKAADEGGDPFTALADGLLHVAKEGELTNGVFQALAAQAGLLPENFGEFTKRVLEQGEALGLDAELLEELRAAMEGTGDEAGDVEGELAGLTDQAGDLADETKDAAAQQRDLKRAYLESANPLFAAQRAVDRLKDAEQKLKDVQEDEEATARDVAEAQLAVAEAALEAEGALLDLGDGDVMAGIRAIADVLGISEEEARNLLEQLGILDSTSVYVPVDVNFRATGSTAAQRAIADNTGVRIGTGSTNAGYRHTGGDINLPKGQEGIATVLGGEKIVSDAHELASAGYVMAAEPSIQVDVHVAGSVIAERNLAELVRNEIVKLKKRNGSTGL